ncbi:MAG: PA14 domain-containing protein, partial [Verrucomicrobia bacterium]|nr:PA14 domain-containing protein [Verrucomicrobiota bacterium]
DYVVTINAPVTIGNLVFNDNNNNGIYDTGDAGVGGVAVQLFNSSNTLVASTTTANTTTSLSGFTVEQAHSSVWMQTYAAATACFSGTSRTAYWSGTADKIDYLVPGDVDGRSALNVDFPTGNSNNFAVRATGTITIPTAGNWTFLMVLDDGGRLKIDGADVIVDESGFHGVGDRFGTVNLTAGAHTLEMVYIGAWGGSVELFAQLGSFSSWNTGFKLVGYTAGGGLAASRTGTGPDVGKYSFSGLGVGSYYVKIPASEFGSAKPLYRRESVPNTVAPADDGKDDMTAANDDGIDVLDVTIDGVRSPLIALSNGVEPTNATTETGFYKTDDDAVDANGNLTVDFGFRTATTGCYHFALWDEDNNDYIERTVPPQSIGFVYNGTTIAYQKQMDVTYNTGTKRFTYDTTFVQKAGQRLDGFYIVLSSGPEPTNNTQSAILYVDLFNRNSPKASMYVYNYNLQNNVFGQDSNISYTNSKLLASSQTTNSPIQLWATESGSTLQVRITADLTAVNNFATPAYSTYGLTSSWEGFAFSNTAGIWSHYYNLLGAPTYNASFQLTSWPLDSAAQGFSYLDTHNVSPIITENICEEKMGVGNLVFKDTNNDGNYDAGEGMDNVLVYLYKQGQAAGVDLPVAAMLTYGGGKYIFNGITAGSYFLHIPSSEFGSGKPLNFTTPISGTSAGDDDLGQNALGLATHPATVGVSTAVFTLAANIEPTDADTETGFDKTSDNFDDNNTDLTLDLGFRSGENLGIGNLVYLDNNGNGRFDAGDAGVPGVKVDLLNASTSAVISSTLTDSATTAQLGFAVTQMNTGSTVVSTYAAANTQLAAANVSNSLSTTAQTLNYYTSGADGRFSSGNAAFPMGSFTNFIVRATGTINIPTAGVWSFGMSSDDGGRIRIDGTDLIVDDTQHAVADRFGNRSLTAGAHTIEVTYWAFSGSDVLEVYAAAGTLTSWSSSFKLIGDTSNGGLAVTTTSTTNLAGRYLFGGLPAGNYVVRIPASEFGVGMPLAGYGSFINGSPTDDQRDDNSVTGSADNGIDASSPATTGISSATIAIGVGTEPNNTLESGFLNTEDDACDTHFDLTVDFAMVAATSDLGDHVFGTLAAGSASQAASTHIGAATTLTVPVTIPVLANVSGSTSRVNVFVDWNGDGDVADTSETLAAQTVAAAGTTNLSFSLTPPVGTTAGTKYLRIRATESSTAPAFAGASALKGEVEDYAISVASCLIVTTTADSGPGSLRNAITCANNNPGAETITFNIPAGMLTGGVAIISPATTLPMVTDQLTIDGTSQTTFGGNTNNVMLGAGGTVGVDGLTLSQVPGPEIEIKGNGDGTTIREGLMFNAANCTVRGIAIHGFGWTNDQQRGDITFAAAGGLVDQCVVGTTATSFTLPAVGGRSMDNGITLFFQGTIQNSLIGFTDDHGIMLIGASNSVVTNCEIRACGRINVGRPNISIRTFDGTFTISNVTISNNLITAHPNWAGADTYSDGPSNNVTFVNNTISNNFIGLSIGNVKATSSVSVFNIDRNIITGNGPTGAIWGISNNVTNNAPQRIKLTKNSIYNNTGPSLDFLFDWTTAGVTPNNGTKNGNLFNSDMDYPVFTSVALSGSNLTVSGYVGNVPAGSATFASATVEVFAADNAPADQSGAVHLADGYNVSHGEGRLYLGALTANGTGLFSGTLTLTAGQIASWTAFLGSAPTSASLVTGTATDATGNTSEFGAIMPIITDFGDWNGSGALTTTTSSTMNSNLRLGASVDAEASVTPNAAASADGADEDGVTLPSSLIQGASTALTVNVTNNTGSSAYLN